MLSLAELANRLHCRLPSAVNPNQRCRGLASLEQAGPEHIAFYHDRRYRRMLKETRAALVICHEDLADEDCPVPCMPLADIRLAMRVVASAFDQRSKAEPGVHASAQLHPDVVLAADVAIGPGCVLGKGVSIGPRSVLQAGVLLAEGCTVGADCILEPGVILKQQVTLGDRCQLDAGAVLGSEGFGLAQDGAGHWQRIPQLGGVRLGNDVEVGANTCIDRGAMDDTVLEDGVKLDNLIQIAHSVRIGAHTAIAAATAIAGSTRIGAHCQIAGAVGITGHLDIADNVVIQAKSLVTKSISQPGIYSSSQPAMPAQQWRRMVAHWRRAVQRK